MEFSLQLVLVWPASSNKWKVPWKPFLPNHISSKLIRHLLSLYPSSRGCGDGSNVRSSPLAYYSSRFKLSAFHYRSTGDRWLEWRPQTFRQQMTLGCLSCTVWSSRLDTLRYNHRVEWNHDKLLWLTPWVLKKVLYGKAPPRGATPYPFTYPV